MTIHVQQRSFLGRAKSMPAASKLGVPSNFLQASTTHKPAPLKPIAIPDKRASSVTSYPSPEVSPDCTTSNYTCASAMESAIASRNCRETMERPIDSPNIHATPQRTSPPPDRDSSRTDELNFASNVGKGCPVAGCQKIFPSASEFMQHARDFHASEFKCSRPYCTFYEIKLSSKAICSHCLKKHPDLLSARNRLRVESQPSSQSELSREIKQHHNREVLQGTELPPPPPPKSPSPRNSTSPNSDNDISIPLSEIHHRRPPTGQVPVTSQTTDVPVEMTDTDSDDTDCEDPDCQDCSDADGEVNWRPFLDYISLVLKDRAMNEFYAITNPQWGNYRRSYGTNSNRTSTTTQSSNSIQTPTSGTSRQNSSNGTALKRGFEDRNSLPPDDRRDNDPKKPRIRSTTDSATINSDWACPYHKREILKSGVNTRYQGCASRHYNCPSKVKEHLYRKHLVFQCERCSREFPTHAERSNHLREKIPCNVGELHVPDGVTEAKKERLKSKKVPHDKIQQWNLIYEILFPGENIPTPYHWSAEGDFINWSREFLPIHAPHDGKEAPNGTQRISEYSTKSAQSIRSSLAAENGYNPSRGSEEIMLFEQMCKNRLSEEFQVVMESELRSFVSGIPEKIRDAYDAVRTSVIQSSIPPNSEVSSVYTRNSLPSVKEVPASTDGYFGNELGFSDANNFDSILACFNPPPPQESFMQMPTLDQAKNATQWPCHTIKDSAYYSSDQVDRHKPNGPLKETTEMAPMNDNAKNNARADPLGDICLTSPSRETFDFPGRQ